MTFDLSFELNNNLSSFPSSSIKNIRVPKFKTRIIIFCSNGKVREKKDVSARSINEVGGELVREEPRELPDMEGLSLERVKQAPMVRKQKHPRKMKKKKRGGRHRKKGGKKSKGARGRDHSETVVGHHQEMITNQGKTNSAPIRQSITRPVHAQKPKL